MAFFEKCRAVTVEAGSTIVPYRFIKIAADGFVDYAAVAQGYVDGISGEDAVLGGTLPMVVADGGFAKLEASEAMAVGALVACVTTDGRGVTWVDAAGNVCMGVVRVAAAAAGDIMTIQFIHKQTGGGS